MSVGVYKSDGWKFDDPAAETAPCRKNPNPKDGEHSVIYIANERRVQNVLKMAGTNLPLHPAK
jgi:hypothetical protein